MMRSRLRGFALALVSTLLMPAAHAVSASAEISNFRFEVVDLDNSDGIAASYRIEDNFSAFSAARITTVGGTEFSDFSTATPESVGLNGITFASVSTFGASMTSSTNNGTYRSDGNATPIHGLLAGFSGGATIGVAQEDFFVAPNTQVVMSADALAQVVGDANCGTLDVACGNATANALIGYVFQNQSGHNVRVDDFLSLAADESGAGESDSASRRLQVVFTNDTDHEASYTLLVLAQLVSVGSIPEPETYALMMAGLGLVAFAVKRRVGRATRSERSYCA